MKIFFDWAKENGYWRKRYQSHTNLTDWVNPQGERVVDKFFDVKIESAEYYNWPYFDTFCYQRNFTQEIQGVRKRLVVMRNHSDYYLEYRDENDEQITLEAGFGVGRRSTTG